MRRRDKLITECGEIDEIIRGSQVCRLALAVENSPYIVPVSFGYDGNGIYFHTAKTGQKIDFIEKNNRVCFEFERNVRLVPHPDEPCKWTFAFESVIGYGTVHELRDREDKMRGLGYIMRQYGGPHESFAEVAIAQIRIWMISIQSMTGKRAEEKHAT
jgi:nitroimidazol reductase NimA-like FMN-containing flavoprotein (pyridoxamine 5'-phosphate oxidase superfamily)